MPPLLSQAEPAAFHRMVAVDQRGGPRQHAVIVSNAVGYGQAGNARRQRPARHLDAKALHKLRNALQPARTAFLLRANAFPQQPGIFLNAFRIQRLAGRMRATPRRQFRRQVAAPPGAPLHIFLKVAVFVQEIGQPLAQALSYILRYFPVGAPGRRFAVVVIIRAAHQKLIGNPQGGGQGIGHYPVIHHRAALFQLPYGARRCPPVRGGGQPLPGHPQQPAGGAHPGGIYGERVHVSTMAPDATLRRAGNSQLPPALAFGRRGSGSSGAPSLSPAAPLPAAQPQRPTGFAPPAGNDQSAP